MDALILISGPMGSGKTTIQKYLERHLSLNGATVSCINFADVIYEMHNVCLDMLKHYGIETPDKDRKLLQLLGTEWGRSLDKDLWVKILKNRVATLHAAGCQFVIVGDCRFENEFDFFPEALRVRLYCPPEVRKERARSWSDTPHESESGLDQYAADGRFDLNLCTDVLSVEECYQKIFDTLVDGVWVAKRNAKEVMR